MSASPTVGAARANVAPMSKRAVIYCRISSDPKGDMLGVQRQERACRDLVEQQGWSVIEVFTDDDRSAYSGKPRPSYNAMLVAVQAGEVDVVVAWAPDRLTRSTLDLEALIDIVEAARVDIATVQSGLYDLSTPSGRMSARVVGAVARYESEHKSARLRAKAAEIAATGRVGGGGTRPYGFDDDRVTHRTAEAKVIRDAAARVVAGETLRGVAADLNQRGVPTVTGARWTSHSLKRILIAARTAGLRQHQGVTIGPAAWAGIIDETTHHQLRAVLLDPARRTNQTARRYLLTSFAVCGLCDTRLVARPRGDKRRCYVCSSGPGFAGCGKIRVLADELEDHVVAMICEAVDTDALAAAVAVEPTDTDTELANSITHLDNELNALADDYADGAISRDAYKRAAARLDARRVDAQAELARGAVVDRRAGVLSDPVPLSERWANLNFDQRRVVVEAVVDAVVVGPAVRGRNYFDQDRVALRWRV
jgi:site-specific DNA recombinase